jgi:acyl-CoA thioester hydrolase
MSSPFHTSWRVRFNEVDLQGVVHHTQIVTYLEIARVEYWRSLGISYRAMRDQGYEFIINKVAVEYKKPLYFDEVIEVSVAVKSMARASFVLEYKIRKEDGGLAIEAQTGLLCSRVGTGKPAPLPDKYKDVLSRTKS